MKRTVKGIQLNVLEQGDGPLTLVFLHYFGGSCLEWQTVMDQLSDQYRCVAVDLPGFGDSDASGSGYSVDTMADAVMNLLELLKIDQFALVGHSMSGKAALALAAGAPRRRQPTGLRALLLVSPSPPLPEPIPDDERQKLLTGYGNRFAAEQTLKNITSVSVSQNVHSQIIADDLRTSKPAWDAWLLNGSKEDISARMATVKVPVFIVVGAEDRALPPDVQTRMVLPFLKRATLTTVPGAGHLLPWETPHELSAFIKKNLPADSPN